MFRHKSRPKADILTKILILNKPENGSVLKSASVVPGCRLKLRPNANQVELI